MLRIKNYWSAFDYTIVDDAVNAPPLTAGQSTNGGSVSADVAANTAAATAAPVTTTGGEGGLSAVSHSGILVEATGVVVGSGSDNTVDTTGGDTTEVTTTGAATTGGTAGVIPAPTGPTASPVVSSSGHHRRNDHHVKIPHFYHLSEGLSTVAYFTPQFVPKHRDSNQEGNHFHPEGLGGDSPYMPDDPNDDSSSSFKGKKGQQHALNPVQQKGPLPQFKEKIKSSKLTEAKSAAAFRAGKRANQK